MRGAADRSVLLPRARAGALPSPGMKRVFTPAGIACNRHAPCFREACVGQQHVDDVIPMTLITHQLFGRATSPSVETARSGTRSPALKSHSALGALAGPIRDHVRV